MYAPFVYVVIFDKCIKKMPIEKIVSLADDVIFVPRIETVFAAVAEIIPLQMLAYYVAKENGCDIDKPKNLAKSVTVE